MTKAVVVIQHPLKALNHGVDSTSTTRSSSSSSGRHRHREGRNDHHNNNNVNVGKTITTNRNITTTTTNNNNGGDTNNNNSNNNSTYRQRSDVSSRNQQQQQQQQQHLLEEDDDDDWTEYRNNPDKVLNIRIDTMSNAITTRDEQIRNVVAVLCPFLWRDINNDDAADDDDNDDGVVPMEDHNDDDDDDDSVDSIDRSSDDVQIKPLTGGLSNHLFVVTANNKCGFGSRRHRHCRQGQGQRRRQQQQHLSSAPRSVLVRVNTEPSAGSSVEIVRREWENRFAAWLAAQDDDNRNDSDTASGSNKGTNNKRLAPTVYGRFLNGRVEEFYPNVRPLTWGQMKDYAPQIASSMADFHHLDAPSNVLPKPSEVYRTRGSIYETTEAWIEAATQLVQESRVKGGRSTLSDDRAYVLVRELQQRWTWLKQQLFDMSSSLAPASSPSSSSTSASSSSSSFSVKEQAVSFIRKVVVTHMDCQPLNILVDDTTADPNDDGSKSKSVHLIDFEYSGWNPIAADIANTFCEYCEMSNLRANYELEYPSPAQQDEFFYHYVRRSDPTLAEKLLLTTTTSTNNNNTTTTTTTDWDVFSKTLQCEVGRFTLLSHLSWTAWSIIKSYEEDGVDFDYMTYAEHRMDGYMWGKAKFFSGCDELN